MRRGVSVPQAWMLVVIMVILRNEGSLVGVVKRFAPSQQDAEGALGFHLPPAALPA